MTEEKEYTRSEMEMRESIVRVDTLLSVSIEDSLEHKSDNENTFNQLFKINKEISEKIDKIPIKITHCRDDLYKELHNDMSKYYVSQVDFKVFTTKVYWSIIGGTSVASIIAWFISLAYTTLKLTGGS